MDFLKQFENKFIPFDIEIKTNGDRILGSTEKDDSNITIDIVNSPVPLKKGPVHYNFSEHEVVIAVFDIFTLDKKQIAQVILKLNYEGEIVYQHTYYYSDNLTLLHSEYTNRHTKIPYETFDFEKGNFEDGETLNITQVDDNVVGASYSYRIFHFLSSSVFTQPTHIENYFDAPYDTQGMNGILTKYIGIKHTFGKKLELDSNCSDEEFEAEIAKYADKYGFIIKPNFTFDYFTDYTLENSKDMVASYLANEDNNLLKDFKGKYIGSISFQSTPPSPLVVVTEQEKEGNTYHCYTILENHDKETIRDSSKDPKYVTKICENGEEELVLYNGQPISKDCADGYDEYKKFVEEFIAPFSGIQPINIEQFMQEPRDLSDGQR